METESAQLAQEQKYADVLYRRVDELTAQVERNLERTQQSTGGGTHQNRSERDAFMALYEDRLVLLRSVSHGVVFGRLDTDERARLYIGRIGLFTPEREQLLVDWRAPAAAAFYQATSVNRQGVRLRRHLVSRGRTVVALEDDVLDQSIIDSDDVVLQGEGALLAAVSSQRTGRMGDIVATIQAEQDRIIRADNRGVMVVQGGPGTGKTAVALHRAAYLLYTHRRRLEHTGVLIMAPTPGFLRYIERVLPSLGESGVVMTTPGALFPGITATAHDDDATARLKGDPIMAELLARAVKKRQRVPKRPTIIHVQGIRLEISPQLIRDARREARATHRPHNRARSVFVRAALERLVELYEQALTAEGHTVLPEDRPDLLADLRRERDVQRALNLAWLPYTPELFLRVLFAHPERLKEAAPQRMSPRLAASLARPKDAPWTVEDVPLLDEVAELLGQDESVERAQAERERRAAQEDIDYARDVLRDLDPEGIVRPEELAERVGGTRDRRTLAERAEADRTWAFGHVVVDEAQELSGMMWRALMRRNPSKSFTVVGDVAQTSAAAGTRSWEEALAPFVEDRLQIEPLTVNYRTPRIIMDAALSLAEAHELPVTAVSSVREGEHPVAVHRAEPGALAEQTAARASALQDEEAGRLAVITAAERIEQVRDAVAAALPSARVGSGSTGVDDMVAVMSPQDAKGLEFDAVIVVEPQELLEGHDRGAGDLFVAMTRPTQRLELVHARDLPAGLELPARA